jgi:transposase
MMGTQASSRQPALFSYHIDLEQRVPTDHLLRRVAAVLDLVFVLPTVRHLYGRSGNVSLDPRVILKMMLLLFLYDVSSERELIEQIGVRLDFLWFLGFDLETEIPDHSVLSKARARWGEEVFQKLFIRMVQQCVEAGLVQGSLLHVDSTIVKASASKDSVVASGPELVNALRQAYQQQQSKLEALPAAEAGTTEAGSIPSPANGAQAQSSAALRAIESTPASDLTGTEPAQISDTSSQGALSAPSGQEAVPVVRALVAPEEPTGPAVEPATSQTVQSASATTSPSLRVLPPVGVPAAQKAEPTKPLGKKLPVNSTHISTTDPEAELARNKSGVTELNYKEHRLVDDAHGVITAVAATSSNVADGSQLPGLYEQHVATTGLRQGQVSVAGDHHYGTATNYIYCAKEGVRAHLADASANLEERGKLPLSQFVYEPKRDRLRCPQGHYLICHQDRPEEQAKVYLIEDPAFCVSCPLREKCTQSKRGRSIQRHVQADLVEAGRAEANSPAGRYSRKRRQHVMEGSFADAFNNHGAKRARWRGLARQRIQSWLIAVVQNLRVLLRNQDNQPARAAAAVAKASGTGLVSRAVGQIASLRVFMAGVELVLARTSSLMTVKL